MKKFFIIFLMFLMFLIGLLSYQFYFTLDNDWRFIGLFVGWFFIGLPSCIWWENYFTNLFKTKE